MSKLKQRNRHDSTSWILSLPTYGGLWSRGNRGAQGTLFIPSSYSTDSKAQGTAVSNPGRQSRKGTLKQLRTHARTTHSYSVITMPL